MNPSNGKLFVASAAFSFFLITAVAVTPAVAAEGKGGYSKHMNAFVECRKSNDIYCMVANLKKVVAIKDLGEKERINALMVLAISLEKINPAEAKKYYSIIEKEFPNSGVAKSAKKKLKKIK